MTGLTPEQATGSGLTEESEEIMQARAWLALDDPSLGSLGRRHVTVLLRSIDRLRADQERTEREKDDWYKAASDLSCNVSQFGEEIERLREAGNALADALGAHIADATAKEALPHGCPECQKLLTVWREAAGSLVAGTGSGSDQ